MARLLLLMVLAAGLWSGPATAGTFVDAERDGLLALIPLPPTDDSIEGAADLEAVLIVQAMRTPEQEQEASLDGDLPPIEWALRALGPDYTLERFPEAFALFEAVRADMTLVVDVVKAAGPMRARPHQRDPERVRPSLSIEGHGSNSWPSGRAAASRVWAAVLSDLFPERAEPLHAAAARTAELRVIGGVHYPTDLIAGYRLADAFLARLQAHPEYRSRLATVRAQGRQAARLPRFTGRTP